MAQYVSFSQKFGFEEEVRMQNASLRKKEVQAAQRFAARVYGLIRHFCSSRFKLVSPHFHHSGDRYVVGRTTLDGQTAAGALQVWQSWEKVMGKRRTRVGWS